MHVMLSDGAGRAVRRGARPARRPRLGPGRRGLRGRSSSACATTCARTASARCCSASPAASTRRWSPPIACDALGAANVVGVSMPSELLLASTPGTTPPSWPSAPAWTTASCRSRRWSTRSWTRSELTGLAEENLQARVRGVDPDGAVQPGGPPRAGHRQQERAGRRLLDALRRLRRRLRPAQGRARRPWSGSWPAGATPRRSGAARRRRSRRTRSPSRRRPSCARASSTQTRCRDYEVLDAILERLRRAATTAARELRRRRLRPRAGRPRAAHGRPRRVEAPPVPRRARRSRPKRSAATAGCRSPTAGASTRSERTGRAAWPVRQAPRAARRVRPAGTARRDCRPATVSDTGARGPAEPASRSPCGAEQARAAAPARVPPRRRARTGSATCRPMKERGERWADAHRLRPVRRRASSTRPASRCCSSATRPRNNVYGYETTLPVTVDELLPLVRAVSRARPARAGRRRPAVRLLPGRAGRRRCDRASRFMKEGARARRQARGRRAAWPPQSRALVGAGIPVMAHIGFTPQSEHALGGYRVQGRGDAAAHACSTTRWRSSRPGAFAVVLEMVPAPVAARGHRGAARSRRSASAPARTATPRCWSGRTWPACARGKAPRFVKRYADLRGVLADAARAYAARGRGPATSPAPEHTFES